MNTVQIAIVNITGKTEGTWMKQLKRSEWMYKDKKIAQRILCRYVLRQNVQISNENKHLQLQFYNFHNKF